MADRKLDIFQLLRAADQCDTEWFSRQPEDAQKEFAPVVASRWASTVGDGQESVYMLWMVNERVNVNLFDLHKHPDLVYRLMASCGLGKALRHVWIAGNKRKPDNNKAYELLQEHYPEANDRELEMLMTLHTKESFSQFVSECGIQSADAKELLKAYAKFGQ